MPMDRRRYPDNWDAIALRIKTAANWTCESCDRPCRKPEEDLHDFVTRIQGINHPDLDWANQTAMSTIAAHPKRFILTVAHLDQDPANNNRSNLKALCTVCHLNHDRPFWLHNRQQKRERQGQLTLELGV